MFHTRQPLKGLFVIFKAGTLLCLAILNIVGEANWLLKVCSKNSSVGVVWCHAMLGIFYTVDVMHRECHGTKWIKLTWNRLTIMLPPLIFSNPRWYQHITVMEGLERNALFFSDMTLCMHFKALWHLSDSSHPWSPEAMGRGRTLGTLNTGNPHI